MMTVLYSHLTRRPEIGFLSYHEAMRLCTVHLHHGLTLAPSSSTPVCSAQSYVQEILFAQKRSIHALAHNFLFLPCLYVGWAFLQVSSLSNFCSKFVAIHSSTELIAVLKTVAHMEKNPLQPMNASTLANYFWFKH